MVAAPGDARDSRVGGWRALVVGLAIPLAAGCGRGAAVGAAPGAAHRVDERRVAMGSALNLSAWTADEALARATFELVFHEFDRLDALMSVWRPGSDVLRLNAAAGIRPVVISPETMEALTIAREVSELTEGRFDVTFGALSDVWKFDQDRDGTVPTPEEIRVRLPRIDYRKLHLDRAAGSAWLEDAGMRVNLGGIGKGYAVDRAVAIVRAHGLRDFLIQAGGDLYVGGTKGGEPWTLGIADPRAPDGPPFARLALSNRTFSTSGDYERAFIKNGIRYHHILDLTTGQPARESRSVTLVTGRAVIADALAKGVFVLGPTAGLALIERLPDVEGVIVSGANEVRVSSGLRDALTIVHAPTDGR